MCCVLVCATGCAMVPSESQNNRECIDVYACVIRIKLMQTKTHTYIHTYIIKGAFSTNTLTDYTFRDQEG